LAEMERAGSLSPSGRSKGVLEKVKIPGTVAARVEEVGSRQKTATTKTSGNVGRSILFIIFIFPEYFMTRQSRSRQLCETGGYIIRWPRGGASGCVEPTARRGATNTSGDEDSGSVSQIRPVKSGCKIYRQS